MATKKTRKSMIISYCKEAGTYRPRYDNLIERLASTLDKIDECEKQFNEEGRQYIVYRVNKAGAENAETNKLIYTIIALEKLAKEYWVELGLTPKAFSSLGEEAVKKTGKKSISEALAEMKKEIMDENKTNGKKSKK